MWYARPSELFFSLENTGEYYNKAPTNLHWLRNDNRCWVRRIILYVVHSIMRNCGRTAHNNTIYHFIITIAVRVHLQILSALNCICHQCRRANWLSIRMSFQIWVYRQRESLAARHYRTCNRACCPRPDTDYWLACLLCAPLSLPYLPICEYTESYRFEIFLSTRDTGRTLCDIVVCVLSFTWYGKCWVHCDTCAIQFA